MRRQICQHREREIAHSVRGKLCSELAHVIITGSLSLAVAKLDYPVESEDVLTPATAICARMITA